MWLLLHITQVMRVMQRAAQQPVGTVASAVMLHAQLRTGQRLLHVLALARALGELRTAPDAQPERYRWTDAGQSWVECGFQDGRLLRWQLHRPVGACARSKIAVFAVACRKPSKDSHGAP